MASVVADLTLLCRNERQVQVASAKIINAPHNAAFQEIVAKAMQERQEGKLAELRVPDDNGDAWEACYAVLSNPRTDLLNWETLPGVLQLADKYELRAVLELCQDRIVCHVLETNKPGPFQKSTLQGRLPWQFEIEVHPQYVTGLPMEVVRNPGFGASVSDCVDFAITLRTVGLMPAYRAFVSAWVASIIEQRNEVGTVGTGNSHKHRVHTYNKRIQRINESLRTGPVCSARLELLSDILGSAAALEE